MRVIDEQLNLPTVVQDVQAGPAYSLLHSLHVLDGAVVFEARCVRVYIYIYIHMYIHM